MQLLVRIDSTVQLIQSASNSCTPGNGCLSDSSCDDGARQLSDAAGLSAAVTSSSSSTQQSRTDRSSSSNSNASSSSSSGAQQLGSPVAAAASGTTATATAAALSRSPAHTGDAVSLPVQQQSPPPQLLALQQRLKQMSEASRAAARAEALLLLCTPQLRAYVQHQAQQKLQLLVQRAPKSAEVQQLSATLLHTLRDGQAALSVLDKYAESKVLPAASVLAALENTLAKVQSSMLASEAIDRHHQQQQQQQQQQQSSSVSAAAAAVPVAATAGIGHKLVLRIYGVACGTG
jgi:hypothetical protein